jgi:hypothetical protein
LLSKLKPKTLSVSYVFDAPINPSAYLLVALFPTASFGKSIFVKVCFG